MTTTLSRLLQVVPSRSQSARDLPALETAMQALALDTRAPLALEIASTATSRQFLLRAEQPVALRHLERQIQARYPQARVCPASTDPLVLVPGEECSVIELRAGASAALPLRSWEARELLAEGTDPLLGILAALGALPAEMRAVVQLVLVPAPAQWSATHRWTMQRTAATSREPRLRAGIGARAEPQIGQVLLLFPVVLVLVLLYLFHGLLPVWLTRAAGALLRGQAPQLSAGHLFAVIVGSILTGLLLLGGIVAVLLLSQRLGHAPLADPQLSDAKTSRMAYRARLRLFLIAPGTMPGAPSARGWQQVQLWLRQVRETLVTWEIRRRSGVRVFHWSTWELHQRETWQRRLSDWQASHMRRRERLDLLRMLVASYRQYHLASGGHFRPCRVSARQIRRLLAPPAGRWLWRRGWDSDVRASAQYLSVADLAALWHLPQAQDLADLAYVERDTTRTLLAPAVLTTGTGYPLGVSSHAGQHLPVQLPLSCLRQNMLIAASTGKGKSTLLQHLMLALAQARAMQVFAGPPGGAMIDPHGDAVHAIAGSLPSACEHDIVLIDLADRAYPIGFNPLDMSGGPDRDKVIDNLIQIVEALWPSSYGPRTESFLEYSCKTLAEANLTLVHDDPLTGADQQYTLLDVVPLLRQTSFRNAVLELVADPHLLTWWRQYYELLDARQQADYSSSLITKLAKFASSHVIRRILGQPRSTLDFAEIIGKNQVLLFSCASGEVGADMAALFGALLVGYVHLALQEQASVRPTERQQFLILVDEFQSLPGINYQTMLAELRKYGGSFGLATQSLAYLDRLERTLRATVLANTEHVFAFTLAEEDARLLHLPGVEPEDVTQLPDYTCYVRLSLAGSRLPTFSVRLSPPQPADDAQYRRILDRCRARYAHPVGEVDEMLRASQARQALFAAEPKPRREHTRGVPYTNSGSEPPKRRRGSGAKPHAQASQEDAPHHLMYERQPPPEKQEDAHQEDA